MGYGTPWYDVSKYATYDTWLSRQSRCIAPTLYENNRLCNCTIDYDDQMEASSLMDTAEALSPGPRRDAAIQNAILFLCCEFGKHRMKLRSNTDGVLTKLVGEYGRRLGYVAPAGAKSEPRSYTNQLPQPPQLPQLPPMEYLVPYTPRKSDSVTVRDEIVQGVDREYDATGLLYCASWPRWPGFVKIGYTAESASDRVAKQEECFAGIRLEASFRFAFPKKIERLVHRELHSRRHEIVVCSSCRHSHEEWFKVPLLEAIQVMSDWHRLTQGDPIYDRERSLRPYWEVKISEFGGEITASKLLNTVAPKDGIIPPSEIVQNASTTTQMAGLEIVELLKEIRMLREELKTVKIFNSNLNEPQPAIKSEPEAISSKLASDIAAIPLNAATSSVKSSGVVTEPPATSGPFAADSPLPGQPVAAKSDVGKTPIAATATTSLFTTPVKKPLSRFVAPENPKGLFAIDQQPQANEDSRTKATSNPSWLFGSGFESQTIAKDTVQAGKPPNSTFMKPRPAISFLTPPPSSSKVSVDASSASKPVFTFGKASPLSHDYEKTSAQTLSTGTQQGSLFTPAKSSVSLFPLTPPTSNVKSDSATGTGASLFGQPAAPKARSIFDSATSTGTLSFGQPTVPGARSIFDSATSSTISPSAAKPLLTPATEPSKGLFSFDKLFESGKSGETFTTDPVVATGPGPFGSAFGLTNQVGSSKTMGQSTQTTTGSAPFVFNHTSTLQNRFFKQSLAEMDLGKKAEVTGKLFSEAQGKDSGFEGNTGLPSSRAFFTFGNGIRSVTQVVTSLPPTWGFTSLTKPITPGKTAEPQKTLDSSSVDTSGSSSAQTTTVAGSRGDTTGDRANIDRHPNSRPEDSSTEARSSTTAINTAVAEKMDDSPEKIKSVLTNDNKILPTTYSSKIALEPVPVQGSNNTKSQSNKKIETLSELEGPIPHELEGSVPLLAVEDMNHSKRPTSPDGKSEGESNSSNNTTDLILTFFNDFMLMADIASSVSKALAIVEDVVEDRNSKDVSLPLDLESELKSPC